MHATTNVWKKPVAKDNLLYDFNSMKYPKQTNL